MERLKERGFQLASLAGVVVVWELVARMVNLSTALPGPSEVVPVFMDLLVDGSAFGPLGSTLGRTALGFALGFSLGLAYGIMVHVSPRFGDYTRGLFNMALFSPTLIIIFIGLVMLGRTDFTAIAIIGFVISTDVGVYMRDAFKNFDNEILDMSRSYQVGLRQRVKDMYLPFLVPPMLAAGRIGFTLAWKVAFLIEVFGFPNGLGWEVRAAYRIYDISTLLSWLILFIATLLIVEQITRITERAVVKW